MPYIIKIQGDENKTRTEIPIDTIRCDLLNKENPEYLNLFQNFPLEKYMCVSPEQQAKLRGHIGDSKYNYEGVIFYVEECMGEQCIKREEILKQFKSFYVVLYFTRFVINNLLVFLF